MSRLGGQGSQMRSCEGRDTLGTRSYAGSFAEMTEMPSHFAGAFKNSSLRRTICHRYNSMIWMPAVHMQAYGLQAGHRRSRIS